MEKILLKKSFRVKDLKIINFNSLWGYKGIFTTIRLVGNKPKLILAEEHIKKLNRDSSRLSINYKLFNISNYGFTNVENISFVDSWISTIAFSFQFYYLII